MRASRIVNRWNLKTRAKAGRYLLNWQERLTQSAVNLVQAGYEQGLSEMSPPPPTEKTHSDGETHVVDRPTSGGSLSEADKDSHL